MKQRTLIFAAALASTCPIASAADIGVSVTVGQPGFYGRIDIGDYPSPMLIYPQPVIVAPPVGVVVAGPPLYLRVPPGHEKHWPRHCAEYGACGRNVYFVRNDWYNNVYVPRYKERHGHRGGEGRGHGHGRGRGHD